MDRIACRSLFVVVTVLVLLSSFNVEAQTTLPKCALGTQTGCVLQQFSFSVLDCLGADTSKCDLTTFCDIAKWTIVKQCFTDASCDGMFWENKDCNQLVGICSNSAAMSAALCPAVAAATPAPGASLAPPTAAPDYEALLRDFYTSTGGANWDKSTNWMTGTGTYCTWYGVSCTGSVVTKLTLSRNNLVGQLPASLGMLYSLTQLDLSENRLTGDIAVLKSLTALEYLHLGTRRLTTVCVFPYQGPGMEDCLGWPDGGQMEGSYSPPNLNVFEGDFMALFAELPNVKSVTLSGDAYGHMDERICIMKDLEFLWFMRLINVTGYIPDCFPTTFNNTLKVWLTDNSNMGGTLPQAISEMHALQQLGLGFNKFEGALPGFPPNIMHYFLNDNLFNGSLPEAQPWPGTANDPVKYNKLEAVLIYSNNISGSLPASWGTMRNLKYIWLSDNKIEGTVPPEWSALDNLLMVALDRNGLSGPTPDTFGYWKTRYTWANVPPPYCQTGPACTLNFVIQPLAASVFPLDMSIVILRLRDNNFTGTIPPLVLQLPDIYDIEFQNNFLTANIEDILLSTGWALKMQNLNLKGNQLGGSLHLSGICSWAKIDILELSNNKIGGSIPDCIHQMNTVKQLRLAYNQLSGFLPDTIGNLTNVQLVQISHNQITGVVPQTVRYMTSLKNWYSSHNQLTGNLFQNVRYFGDLESVTTVNIESNNITGMFSLFILFEVGDTKPRWQSIKSWNFANNRIEGSLPFVFDQYVQEISYLNVEGNQMSGKIPVFPSLDVLLVARNPKMRTDTDDPLPTFLRATEFSVRRDPTYSCPVVSGADREMVVSVDPEYYNFTLCKCEAGYFGYPPNCRPCIEHGVCDGKSPYMKIPAGRYPTPDAVNPSFLIRCRSDMADGDAPACNPDNEYQFRCKTGHSGRLCAKCEDGYYQKDARCLKCPSQVTSIVIILVVFLALIILALLLRKLPKGRREAVLVVKVLILYMQFGGTFLTKTGLVWPKSMVGLNNVFDITNVNLGFFSCSVGESVIDLNFESEIYGTLIFIGLGLALIGFMIVFFELLNWIRISDEVEEVESTTDDKNWDLEVEERLETEVDNARLYFNYHRSIFETTDGTVKKMKPKFFVVRGVITLLKFLYLPVTTSILQLFQCEKDPGLNNRRFMTYNPPRECSFDDSLYLRNFVFAMVLVPVYILGLPTFIVVIARRYETREKVARNVWFFLFNDFRPGQAMYIMWQLLRQLILSVICVLVPKDANVTLTLLVVHFFVMLMIHLYFEPYMEQCHNFNEGIALTCLTLTLAFGLVSSQVDGAQEETIATFLLLVQISFLVCIIYAFLMHSKIIPTATAKKMPFYDLIMFHKQSKDDSDDTESLASEGISPAALSTPGSRGRSMLDLYGRGSKGELRAWLERSDGVLNSAVNSTFAKHSTSFETKAVKTMKMVAELRLEFLEMDEKRKATREAISMASSIDATQCSQGTITPMAERTLLDSSSRLEDCESPGASMGPNDRWHTAEPTAFEEPTKNDDAGAVPGAVEPLEDVTMTDEMSGQTPDIVSPLETKDEFNGSRATSST